MDDEDRENEGDLVIAAQCVRPEDINFMITHARGLVCLTLTRERCEQLKLPLMVQNNGAAFSTNFTLSIEAAKGVTTGISAADRAVTVHAAVKSDAQPEDIVQPGHIFPLMAQPGGVLSRPVIRKLVATWRVWPDLRRRRLLLRSSMKTAAWHAVLIWKSFAAKHGIKIGTIADLIHYRTRNEHTVERVGEGVLPTEFGEFRYVSYRDEIQNCTHLALVKGDIDPNEPTLVRVHVRTEVLRDVVGVRRGPEVKWTMRRALERVANEGKGVGAVDR